jgi:DNA gyrase subunit A
MVISQFGKIIRINSKSIRSAGRSTQASRPWTSNRGQVAAAVVIPQKAKPNPN